MGVFRQMASSIGSAVALFFTFPEDARWNAKRQAVEFGVEIGDYQGWFGSRGGFSCACSRSGPPPDGCVEAYYRLTRFETLVYQRTCAGGFDQRRQSGMPSKNAFERPVRMLKEVWDAL
jgi:hypothetical protein